MRNTNSLPTLMTCFLPVSIISIRMWNRLPCTPVRKTCLTDCSCALSPNCLSKPGSPEVWIPFRRNPNGMWIQMAPWSYWLRSRNPTPNISRPILTTVWPSGFRKNPFSIFWITFPTTAISKSPLRTKPIMNTPLPLLPDEIQNV